MLEGFVTWLFSLMQSYGALSVFFGVLIEEIVVPIPSALILTGAGFILIPQNIPVSEAFVLVLHLIVIPAAIAGTIGSFFMYAVGYYGGERVIKRFRRFLGVEWEDIQKEKKRLETTRTWFMIAVLRAIPFIPISIVSLTSGVLRLDWKRFALSTFLGSIPRSFALGFLGWYLGSAYISVSSYISGIENILVIMFIIAVLLYLYWRKHRK